jgi:preprotein translocase subunit SecD
MSKRAAWLRLTLTLVVVYGALALTQFTNTTPLLGLDLQGGFSVILEAPEGTDEDVLDQAVEIMRRRIEALGEVQEPEIAVVGGTTVEVQLPGVTNRDRALEAVGTTGLLDFRPVLDIGSLPGFSPVFEDIAPTTTTTIPDGETTTTVPDTAGTTPTTVGDGTTTTAPPTAGSTSTTTVPTTTTTSPDTTTTTAGDGETTTTSSTTTVPVDPTEGVVLPEGVTWCDEVDQPGCVDPESGLTLDPVPELEAFLSTDFASGGGIIYHLDVARAQGSDLESAMAQFITQGGGPTGGGVLGQWVVELNFTSEGEDKFTELTKELASYLIGDPRRQFAIVLDGVVQSAPQVAEDIDPNVGISGGSAIITLGSSDNQESEARNLAIVLRYGALPVAFSQSSVESVSATLGADSLQAGLVAGIGGLILVAAAMILYYRALGLVNVIGLTVFGSLVLVIFSLLGAWQGVTLTLAGVAGVIVSVGITSDSYIVYFERIKEEVHRGRSLRGAIDHAFGRSIRTILTADTVSFAGAVLLFFLAIGSVKGFALALGIATVCDVLVAIFYTKPAVALVARSKLGEGGTMSIRGATGLPPEAMSS